MFRSSKIKQSFSVTGSKVQWQHVSEAFRLFADQPHYFLMTFTLNGIYSSHKETSLCSSISAALTPASALLYFFHRSALFPVPRSANYHQPFKSCLVQLPLLIRHLPDASGLQISIFPVYSHSVLFFLKIAYGTLYLL